MKHLLIVAGFLLGLLFLLAQCTANKGNPVGSQFFQRENQGSEMYALFHAAASDTFYQTFVANGSSPYLYLGQCNGKKTWSLILFSNLPDSGTVDSALVTLHTHHIFGQTSGFFTASVHLILKEWNPTEITWETFDNSFIGEEIANVEISADQISANNDTMALSFHLPPATVQSWIDSTTDSLNYGILLMYQSAPFIVEFFSNNTEELEYRPTLTIYLKQDTTKEGSVTYPRKDTFIASTEQEPNFTRLFVNNGTALRSLIYFSIDSLPEDATINRALLTLHADTLLSFPDNESFDLITYPVTNNTWPIPAVPFDSTTMGWSTLEGDSISINVTNIVQKWTSGKNENYGFILMGKNEKRDIFGRAFYSTSCDSLYQPTLEIFYSLPPNSRL